MKDIKTIIKTIEKTFLNFLYFKYLFSLNSFFTNGIFSSIKTFLKVNINISKKTRKTEIISTGIPCLFNTDFHTQLILASQSKPGDVAILFCYTGINRDSIDIAKVLKEKGCTIIIVTRDDNSPINQYADLGIYVSGMTAPSEITDTYPERISLSVIVDVLYLIVISKLKDKSIKPVKNVVEIEKTRRL